MSGGWAQHLNEVPPGWHYKAHTGLGWAPNAHLVTETRFWSFLFKLHQTFVLGRSPQTPDRGSALSMGIRDDFERGNRRRSRDVRMDSPSWGSSLAGPAAWRCCPSPAG